MFMSKGINLTGLLGDIKEDWESGGRKSPGGVQGQSPGKRSEGRCPTEAEAFFVNYT